MNTQSKLHRTLQALFITGISVFLGAVTVSQSAAQDPSWTLQERTLPVPAAASEALRASIENTPQPEVMHMLKKGADDAY